MKKYPQKVYLFAIYGSFIFVLLCTFFIFMYSHYRTNTLKEASKDLENVCDSIENAVENQLDNISSISMNIVYSNAIKSNFKQFSDVSHHGEIAAESIVDSREWLMQIHDIVTAMIGAYQTASGINLYTLNGDRVESGYWLRTTTVDLTAIPWYEKVLELNGHKFITAPAVNKNLPAKGENQKSQKFISLVRTFLDSDGQPEGIVEVVQDCDKIFSLASQVEKQNPHSKVYIYNERRELVYPYNHNRQEEIDFLTVKKENGLTDIKSKIVKIRNQENGLMSYQNIRKYNWSVIAVKPESAVYEGMKSFQIIFFLIGGGSILLTLWICFYMAQRLTAPLQKLTKAAGKITINRVLSEDKINLTSADSRIEELSLLCEAIRDMYEKLRSTSQQVILAQTEENRAKLQATQSLINPHFLYNSLTSMSIMAEENMNDEIIKMSQALCEYFRYISASAETIVTLEKEIFYTKQYLKCMEMRFHEEFSYSVVLQQDTTLIYIPKLILQPIVENAFKHGFIGKSPWLLSISSYQKDRKWFLRVEDNGGQMTPEIRAKLLESFHSLDWNRELKQMEVGGMGLKNVYLRLKLLYKKQAVFEIECTKQKTAFIIGGPVYYVREDYDERRESI